MKKDYYENSKDYVNRWVISYADFVTMLLALFLVMFAVSRSDALKVDAVQTEIKKQFTKNEFTSNNDPKYNSNVNLSKEDLLKFFEESFIDKEKIMLVEDERGIVIRVNNTILFDAGSAKIKNEAKKTLEEILQVLTKIDNPVIIEGHTDATPIKSSQYPSNWELSTARATNIISYMLNTKKISPSRLSALGYGEYSPIADNTSLDGRNRNRRVDIIVLNKK
jgi:chemotaxis protein MotB